MNREVSASRDRSGYPWGQRGSVLIVSLIMLLLLTLIAVAAMRTTILQERMAVNLHDRGLAFQAAEAALRDAERMLREDPPEKFFNANGLYDVNSAGRPFWVEGPLSAGNGALTYSGNLDGVVQQPQYFIERIATIRPAGTETETGTALPPVSYFRITTLGVGGTPESVVVVSSVYRNQ